MLLMAVSRTRSWRARDATQRPWGESRFRLGGFPGGRRPGCSTVRTHGRSPAGRKRRHPPWAAYSRPTCAQGRSSRGGLLACWRPVMRLVCMFLRRGPCIGPAGGTRVAPRDGRRSRPRRRALHLAPETPTAASTGSPSLGGRPTETLTRPSVGGANNLIPTKIATSSEVAGMHQPTQLQPPVCKTRVCDTPQRARRRNSSVGRVSFSALDDVQCLPERARQPADHHHFPRALARPIPPRGLSMFRLLSAEMPEGRPGFPGTPLSAYGSSSPPRV